MNFNQCAGFLNPGQERHLCLFYERDAGEQISLLIPYIREGFDHHEQVVYVADDQSLGELSRRLEENGIKVAEECQRGRLKLWTRKQWRPAAGLDNAQKLLPLRRHFAEAGAAGFKGIRFAVEMTWTLGPDLSAEEIERWERNLDTLFVPGFQGSMVCLYNRNRLSPEVILSALETHPLVMIGPEACPNWFYQPTIANSNPDAEKGADAKIARIDWMLAQLRQARAVEQEREKLMWKEAEEELERVVADRTAELTDTNNQLDAFVYSIAHDLRAPLRSIQAFSSMLLEDHASSLDATGQDYARRIVRTAESMDRLVLDLLAYGRVARSEIELSPVPVERAWAAAVSQNERMIAESNARVEVVPPLPQVHAQEAILAQVLANLLDNALKFVNRGVTPHVVLRAEERQEGIRLWVEDNGLGIAPEHQERVFRIFERLNGKAYRGTGIGLSIVRKGVERMGGKVGVESTLGQGCRFWIELQKSTGPLTL